MEQNQPANTPEPAAPATTPETPSAPAGGGENVQQILNFDPFEPTSAGLPQANTPQPTDPNAVPQPGQAPQPGQVAAPTAPQVDPNAERLERIEAALAAMAAQGRGFQPQEPGAPQAPQSGTQPQGQQPQRNYNFQFTPELMQGLNHEDPNVRNQSLVNLVNGVGEIIHNTVLQQVQTMLQSVREEVPQVAQTTTQQLAEHQKVFDDFYGKFPELNQPTFHALVGQIAKSFYDKNPRAGWSPALRDEIGREVYRILKWPVPGARTAAPQPAPQTTPSARGGTPAPLSDQAKEIAEMFS